MFFFCRREILRVPHFLEQHTLYTQGYSSEKGEMLAAINEISVDIIMSCGIGVSIAASVTVWNTNLNTIWYYGNTKDSIDWFRYAFTHSIFYESRE